MGLRAAADIIAKHIWAGQMTMATVCDRTGLSSPVLLKFLNQHRATEHTLVCLEAAFNVPLVRPEAALYRPVALQSRWCGYDYEIRGPGGVIKGWHRGSEIEVRAYVARVIQRAHRDATVLR